VILKPEDWICFKISVPKQKRSWWRLPLFCIPGTFCFWCIEKKRLSGKISYLHPPPREAESIPMVSEKQQRQPCLRLADELPRLLSRQGAVPAPNLHSLNHALKGSLLHPLPGAAKGAEREPLPCNWMWGCRLGLLHTKGSWGGRISLWSDLTFSWPDTNCSGQIPELIFISFG